MKKKLLAALMVTTMAVAGLAGCGDSGSTGSGNSGNGGGHYRCRTESVLSPEPGGYRHYGTAAAGICCGASGV